MMAKRRFIKTLLIITGMYCIWLLAMYFAQDLRREQAPPSEQMSYSDLAAAYNKLQEQLQKADSTHIIRRYQGRYALFNAQEAFDEEVMALSRKHFEGEKAAQSLFLDLPELDWKRIDNARPVDALRLTFRGNGVPRDVERLAKSGLLDPKLHAFYNALIKPNTTLWVKKDAAIDFDIRTTQGDLYRATSTPFIAVQRLSKEDYAKLKAASLPFLWKAYINEESAREQQSNLLSEPFGPPDLIGPYLPEALMPPAPASKAVIGPHYPRTQAEVMASETDRKASPESQGPLIPAQGAGSVLEALPGLSDALQQAASAPEAQPMLSEAQTPTVSGFTIDEATLEALLEESLINQSDNLADTLEMKKAINAQRRNKKEAVSRHIERLARLDSEFIALFLINNMFEQYNIFSVFEEGVSMTVNALDTRLNVLYVSYDLRFNPPAQLDLDEAIRAGCGGRPVRISDEFFLIAAKPYSYLIRIYLPACKLENADYDAVDRFIDNIRILH